MPRTPQVPLLLAAVFAASAPSAVSAQARWENLSDGWQLLAAEDPAGGSLERSGVSLGATWMDLDLLGFEGTVRLSREIRLEPGQSADAIVVGPTRHGWYRLYANGERLGQVGSPFHDMPYPVPHLFPVEVGPEPLLVELEFHRNRWASDAVADVNGPVEGGIFVGDSTALADQLDLGRRRRMMAELLALILSAVFVVAGLYHVELYTRRRTQSAYLWFGLGALAFAGNTVVYSSWVVETTGWLTVPFRLNEAFGHLATASLIQFLWEILGRPIGRLLRAYQWSHVAIAVALLVLPFAWVYDTTAYRVPWVYPILVVAGWTLLRDAYDGHPEARVIVVGAAVLILTVALDSVRALAPGVPAGLPALGFATTLVAMALSLGRRFSRVHTELDELRTDLEVKVHQRTSQLAEAMSHVRMASDAKSQFLATMSHELRTPLTSVIGFSSLLLNNEAADLGETERGYVERINASGGHLLELVNKVLDISAIEAGRFEILLSPTELAPLVTGVAEDLALAAEAKGLSLEVDIAQGLPPVETDGLRVKQVVVNLVGNAIKFTEEGGVRVSLGRNGDDRIALEVSDTGVGVPADRLRTIFEPFEQLEGSYKRRSEGTGLGLAISLWVCELLGADLGVRSEVGVGSTFRMVFPPEEGVRRT